MVRLISSLFLILSFFGAVCRAQNDAWLRVVTGDSYVIEIDKTSLKLKEGGIICADFRTSYESAEIIAGKPDLKYWKRIDTIEFKVTGRSYRIVESSFLESTSKVISQTANPDLKWKQPIASARLFYSAAAKLAPLGSWRVLSYRYLSGDGPSNSDPPEITAMVGTAVSIRLENFFIGRSNCPGPSFDFKTVADKDLERYGFTLKSLGMDTTSVKTIRVGCGSNNDYPSQTLIFLQTPIKGTMLWDGVLFDIERLPNIFS